MFAGGDRNKKNDKKSTRDLSTIDKGYRLADKYEVIKKIGEGGFGAAFLVKSLTANVSVNYVAKAQKLTNNPAQNQDLITRFKRESQTLQKLGSAHGQIPSLFDFFEFEGNFYLIQEYVKGQTLADVLMAKVQKKSTFSSQEIIDIILSLLEVLIKVHGENVIHRDIKPQNIILREGDNKPVLIDFGLIKEVSYSTLDQTGTQAGTMGYCPLEQMCGKAMYQSDLFAVGMTMLVCLTGIGAHGFKIEPNPIVDPQNAKVRLDGLEEIIGKILTVFIQESLAVLPQNRFESAQEMRETLLQIKNAQYMAMGANHAKNEMEKMRKEIERLKGQLKTQDKDFKHEKSGIKQVAKDNKINQIITTQKEVDGFNIIKRIIKNNGLDDTRLKLKDTVEFCGINIDNDEKKTLIRLYFNDENNLNFAIILKDGKEDKYELKTLRGISPKKEKILDRARELMTNKKAPAVSNNALLDTAIDQMRIPQKEEQKKGKDLGKFKDLF